MYDLRIRTLVCLLVSCNSLLMLFSLWITIASLLDMFCTISINYAAKVFTVCDAFKVIIMIFFEFLLAGWFLPSYIMYFKHKFGYTFFLHRAFSHLGLGVLILWGCLK